MQSCMWRFSGAHEKKTSFMSCRENSQKSERLPSTESEFHNQCPPSLFLQGGGPEKFSILAKRGELALFEFLGGRSE